MFRLIKSTLFLGGIFDIDVLNKKLNSLKEKTTDSIFWSNNKKASAVLKNISRIEKEIKLWNDIEEKQRSFNKYSQTGAMNSIYQESNAVNRFLNRNRNIYACGMVAYINGSIASFESGPNNTFFNELFPDLVKSIYQESLLYKNTSKSYSSFFSTNKYFNYLRKVDRCLNKVSGRRKSKDVEILFFNERFVKHPNHKSG